MGEEPTPCHCRIARPDPVWKDRVGLIRCLPGRVPLVSQESRAHRGTEPIRGRPLSWASDRPWVSVFVQFFRFIDQLGCDLRTLGFPLS